jgi:hypothetical protein
MTFHSQSAEIRNFSEFSMQKDQFSGHSQATEWHHGQKLLETVRAVPEPGEDGGAPQSHRPIEASDEAFGP